jgi:hypothetical protein
MGTSPILRHSSSRTKPPLCPIPALTIQTGEGECREKLKRLCSVSSASPGDRVARTVGSFFCKNSVDARARDRAAPRAERCARDAVAMQSKVEVRPRRSPEQSNATHLGARGVVLPQLVGSSVRAGDVVGDAARRAYLERI